MLDILALGERLNRPVVIGMVHLKPLPGAPRFPEAPGDTGNMGNIIDAALGDAQALASGGVDALLVENFGDAPFFPGKVPPVTVAAMTRCVNAVLETVEIPVGVNVLRNDVEAALSIAEVCGADFIRANILTGAMATDQGLIQGNAHDIMRLRRALGSDVSIFADILVKHAAPLVENDPVAIAIETVERGLADGIIITGSSTGDPADPGHLKRVKEVVEVPVIVGSGINKQNVEDFLAPPGRADALIVGSYFKEGGRPPGQVEKKKVWELMASLF